MSEIAGLGGVMLGGRQKNRNVGSLVVVIVLVATAVALPATARADCPPDPHPCGGEWPSGLTGPFDLARSDRVSVKTHDDIRLDGWVSFPTTPPGVKLPVILISTPYLNACYVDPVAGPVGCNRHPHNPVGLPLGGPGFWDDRPDQVDADQSANGLGIAPIRWIRRGFVLAYFSLRGTGHSGGCFEFGGRNEQRDQATLIEWLASQDWSNGRVAMGGLSHPAWVTWQGAVRASSALKAIVSVAPVTDPYTYYYTPQGARHTYPGLQLSHRIPQYRLGGPAYAWNDPNTISQTVTDPVSRAGCPDLVELATVTPKNHLGIERSRSFFEERDLTARLGNVKAAVLHAQGYHDMVAHLWQDRTLSSMLPASTPVREVRGWWPHEYPGRAGAFTPDPSWGEAGWEDIVTGWLEYWLKGVGTVPRLSIDHQDQRGDWHASTAWPPPEAREEILYLASGELSAARGGDDATFHSVPPPGDASWFVTAVGAHSSVPPIEASACSGFPPGEAVAAAYVSDPVDSDVVIAGNPTLDVEVSSSISGGLVSASVLAIAPELRCEEGRLSGVTWLATGGADLEFYRSRYDRTAFAIDTPTQIRIDISDLTAVVSAGHRLAVVLSHGEAAERSADPGRYPQITIHAGNDDASRITLPVIAGRFGG